MILADVALVPRLACGRCELGRDLQIASASRRGIIVVCPRARGADGARFNSSATACATRPILTPTDERPTEAPLLDVKTFASFFTADGEVGAVQNVSFSIQRGRTLASSAIRQRKPHRHAILETPSSRRAGCWRTHPAAVGRRWAKIDIDCSTRNRPALQGGRGGLVSMIFQEPTTACRR